MKRDTRLQHFSREHHQALVLALRIAKAADEAAITGLLAAVPVFFRDELEAHFAAEERDLLPALAGSANAALAERTLDEHRQMRHVATRIAAGEVPALADFGKLLRAHVQFEEGELFPAVERAMARSGVGLDSSP